MKMNWPNRCYTWRNKIAILVAQMLPYRVREWVYVSMVANYTRNSSKELGQVTAMEVIQ